MIWLTILMACGLRSSDLAYTGTIEVTEVEVASTVGGRLLEVLPREGQKLSPGDLVFRVDDALLQADRAVREAGLAQAAAGQKGAAAQVRAANAQVAMLRRELDRVQALEAAGVGTAQQTSQLSGQLDVARAQALAAAEMVGQADAGAKQAQAGLDAAETRLAEASVSVAVDGVVISRNREPGEVIGPGMSVLTVGDLAHPRLKIFVPLLRVETLAIGDPVTVKLDGADAIGAIERIASEAEFTPREILTPDERVKRVFAVDIALQPGPGVHAGMPADAYLADD